MPTQTELEFYKAFDIPKIDFKGCGWQADCPFELQPCEECCYWEVYKTDYPNIDNKRVLELLRLGLNCDFAIYSKDLEELKEKLLKLLIYNKTDEIYHAVRKIMGVGDETKDIKEKTKTSLQQNKGKLIFEDSIMTDKETIINDINVSGCGFFHPECGDYSCHIALAFPDEYTDAKNTYFKCEQNPECLYKQLQRKEEELQSLKAENEELRTELQISKDDHVYAVELEKDIDCYKQALERIKKTATDLKTRKDYHSLDEVITDIDKILTIINEVKDE